jgi:hypothetical protein
MAESSKTPLAGSAPFIPANGREPLPAPTSNYQATNAESNQQVGNACEQVTFYTSLHISCADTPLQSDSVNAQLHIDSALAPARIDGKNWKYFSVENVTHRRDENLDH